MPPSSSQSEKLTLADQIESHLVQRKWGPAARRRPIPQQRRTPARQCGPPHTADRPAPRVARCRYSPRRNCARSLRLCVASGSPRTSGRRRHQLIAATRPRDGFPSTRTSARAWWYALAWHRGDSRHERLTHFADAAHHVLRRANETRCSGRASCTAPHGRGHRHDLQECQEEDGQLFKVRRRSSRIGSNVMTTVVRPMLR